MSNDKSKRVVNQIGVVHRVINVALNFQIIICFINYFSPIPYFN